MQKEIEKLKKLRGVKSEQLMRSSGTHFRKSCSFVCLIESSIVLLFIVKSHGYKDVVFPNGVKLSDLVLLPTKERRSALEKIPNPDKELVSKYTSCVHLFILMQSMLGKSWI
jgi:hypothetical protein